jgi:nucleotide-binding universal stress UspA family protein
MLIFAVTTNPLHITPIGIIIAVVFLCSIVGVLGWMLRIPEETETARTAARVVRAVNKQTHILVPLLQSGEATDRVVAIAAQMARPRDGEVELLATIEVPFTLPLNAHVEHDERHAQEALERAEAVIAHCCPRNELKVRRRILKARSAGVAIIHEAEEQATDMILIANIPVSARGSTQQIDPRVEYVMRNAPCEVMVFSQGSTAAVPEREAVAATR